MCFLSIDVDCNLFGCFQFHILSTGGASFAEITDICLCVVD